MGIFGWSYPPGAANDPNAPWNQQDEPCEVCGEFPDNCICPECPVCTEIGNKDCYEHHGLVRTQEQIDSLAKKEAEWEEKCRRDNEAADEAIKTIFDD